MKALLKLDKVALNIDWGNDLIIIRSSQLLPSDCSWCSR